MIAPVFTKILCDSNCRLLRSVAFRRDEIVSGITDTMHKRVADMPELILLDAVETTHIYNNRFWCDHGWDIDLDDVLF